METSIQGSIPVFGPSISREHLLKVFLAHRPALTLACAPPGYGKSILAAQLVEAGGFEFTLWIPAHDEDIDSERLLVMAAQALASVRGELHQSDAAPTSSTTDAWLAITGLLKSQTFRSICVVFDGCHALTNLKILQDLACLLRQRTSNHSSVIATCRSASLHEGASLRPGESWFVEEQDLRFSDDEVLLLFSSTHSQDDEAPRQVERLLCRFQGHPALTALMLRHADLDDEIRPPRDLVWYVDRLVASLSTDTLAVLYAASLLQEDKLSVLRLIAGVGGLEGSLRCLAPLMSMLPADSLEPVRFRAHSVLRDIALEQSCVRLQPDRTRDIRRSVIDHLYSEAAYDRIRQILLTECSEDEVATWCRDHGQRMLGTLGAGPTLEVVKRISPILLFEHHDLLLLLSRVQYALEQYSDSFTSAEAAACIAEAHADYSEWAACVLMAARAKGSSGDFSAAHKLLTSLDHCLVRLSPGLRAYVTAYAAVVETQIGETKKALARARSIDLSLVSGDSMEASDAFMTVNSVAGVVGLSTGRWSEALRLLAPLCARNDLSPSEQCWLRSNIAVCKMEMGSLQEAQAILDSAIEETEAAGCWVTAGHARGSRSSLHYSLGDSEAGATDFDASQKLLTSSGHHDVAVAEKLNAAVNLRAIGKFEESLVLAEQVEVVVPRVGTGTIVSLELVEAEVAASMLALGDVWSAKTRAEAVQAKVRHLHLHDVSLRAALVLAEVLRIEGRLELAANILRGHLDYLATGSANRLVAMYVRSFPGLLGVLTEAVGADNIPLRMLLMIPVETIEAACALETGLSGEDAEILRRRGGNELMRLVPQPLPGPEGVSITQSAPAPACYVRLFGGLEVKTKDGLVDDSQWRKRKARLVFAILVLKQHQDVPRDVLLEHLWPDMDDEHAKRNFYVTWSTMKRALACGGAPSAARQYVQCTGGVCRLTKDVRSDVDDFDDAIAALRSASSAGDTDATLAAAQTLVGLYRGELLPGDLYEEWFTDVRERTKHDFCDAMMCAATVAEDAGDSETALFLLRKAALADPWREDVYQSTMRCQMHAGQRSRAIETYLSCRSRLTEDLGIDPSIETTRIYQSVLAMEEADETPVQYATE